MRIEGDFAADGFVIVRELFDPAWVERMLPILEAARAAHAVENPETGAPGGSPALVTSPSSTVTVAGSFGLE